MTFQVVMQSSTPGVFGPLVVASIFTGLCVANPLGLQQGRLPCPYRLLLLYKLSPLLERCPAPAAAHVPLQEAAGDCCGGAQRVSTQS